MPESVDQPAPAPAAPDHTDVELPRTAEILDDLTRTIARQQATIERLVDGVRRLESTGRSGADVPLLVDLSAIRSDAIGCARTAQSERERTGFEALAAAIDRLIVGRGGGVVTPAVGGDFSAATMEVAEVVRTDDPAEDRTIDRVVAEGLRLAESAGTSRSIRPALVVVRRYRGSTQRPADTREKSTQSTGEGVT